MDRLHLAAFIPGGFLRCGKHRVPGLGTESLERRDPTGAGTPEQQQFLQQALGGQALNSQQTCDRGISRLAKTQQEMLAAHVAMAQPGRQGLRTIDSGGRRRGKPFSHACSPALSLSDVYKRQPNGYRACAGP